jgi:hypothetical protein
MVGVSPGEEPKSESATTQCKWRERGSGGGGEDRRRRSPARLRPRGFGGLRRAAPHLGEGEWRGLRAGMRRWSGGVGFCRFGGDETRRVRAWWPKPPVWALCAPEAGGGTWVAVQARIDSRLVLLRAKVYEKCDGLFQNRHETGFSLSGVFIRNMNFVWRRPFY